MEKNALDALLTKLVHDIVQFGGRDPSGLQVSSTQDGGICVRSAYASFVYPLEGWTHAFNQHLDAGLFDRPARGAPVVPANRAEIDMDNPREVRWWTKRFACSEHQLRDAVRQVGPNAARVEQLLDGQESSLRA